MSKIIFSSKDKVAAVHFLDRAKFPGGEILCGTPLPAGLRVWEERSTTDTTKVRCKECRDLLVSDGRMPRHD